MGAGLIPGSLGIGSGGSFCPFRLARPMTLEGVKWRIYGCHCMWQNILAIQAI